MYTYVHCILSTPIYQQTPNLLIFEEKVWLGPFEVWYFPLITSSQKLKKKCNCLFCLKTTLITQHRFLKNVQCTLFHIVNIFHNILQKCFSNFLRISTHFAAHTKEETTIYTDLWPFGDFIITIMNSCWVFLRNWLLMSNLGAEEVNDNTKNCDRSSRDYWFLSHIIEISPMAVEGKMGELNSPFHLTHVYRRLE